MINRRGRVVAIATAGVAACIGFAAAGAAPAGANTSPQVEDASDQQGPTTPAPDKENADQPPTEGQLQTARLVERLDTAIEAVNRRARGDAAFGGVRMDVDNRGIEVFRRSDRGRQAPNYRADVPSDVSLRVTESMLTDAETKSLHQLVEAKAGWLAENGVTVREWGRDSQEGPFIIGYAGTTQPDDRLLDPFREYGEDTVEFAPSDLEDLGRMNDSTPFYAGNRVIGTQHPSSGLSSSCSTGFSVKSLANASTYVIVSNHCLNPADARFWTPAGLFMGSATSSDVGLDAAYVKTSSKAMMWAEPYGSGGFAKSVTGFATANAGAPVCVSGSYTLNTCAGEMYIVGDKSWMNTNFYTGVQTSTNGVGITTKTGAVIGAKGDSGGPAYSLTASGTASARAIISAGTDIATCPSYIGAGETCYRSIYASKISDIASTRSLTLSGF